MLKIYFLVISCLVWQVVSIRLPMYNGIHQLLPYYTRPLVTGGGPGLSLNDIKSMNIIPNSPFSCLFVDPRSNQVQNKTTIDVQMFNLTDINGLEKYKYLHGEWLNINYTWNFMDNNIDDKVVTV